MKRKIFSIFISIFLFLISSKVSAQGILEIEIPKGSCLSGIAIEYQTDIATLLRLNPQIKNPDLIFAGDILKVPASTTKIVIPPGATLSSLALKYNTTIEILLALNPQIKNPDLIYAGDELIIPSGKAQISEISEISPLSQPATTTPSVTTTTLEITTSTLSVSFSANPSSGFSPLMGIDLKAEISGIATGTFNYTFYCDSSDESTEVKSGWCKRVENTEQFSYIATNCCDYQKKGIYFPKVIVEWKNLKVQARTKVEVKSYSPPPSPSALPPPCQDQYPSGAHTYSVSTKSIPKIYQIVIDPLDVEYLSPQTVRASITDANGNPITSVVGTAITDNKSVNFTLNLISGSETNGVWQGSWILQDSICENYQVAVQAQSESGISKVTLSFR